MNIGHFTDDRIDEIYRGSPLTEEERTFLITDTPAFDGFSLSEAELAAMRDADLMREAFHVWADYASCM